MSTDREYNGYLITTDKSLMDKQAIHHWLSTQSYWANGIPFDVFESSFDHSYCIGGLLRGEQVAYARLVTDFATFGYLADVFVIEAHRGNGLSKIMMDTLFQLEWVKKLRRIMLATRDAQALYERSGFTNCRYPERIMEISRPDLYLKRDEHC